MDPQEQLRADVEFVRAELERLQEVSRAEGFEGFTDEQSRAVDEGIEFIRTGERELQRYDDLARAAARPGGREPGEYVPPAGVNVNRNGDPFDLDAVAREDGASARGRARTAIERVDGLDDRHREAATQMLARADSQRGDLARHVVATGSDAYRTAFQKMVAGQSHLLNDRERSALDAARALALDPGSDGGLAVPFTLDPTIINTKDMSTNPFRRISTIKTTLTNSWNGVASAGMSVTWDGEAAQVGDNSPSIAARPIPVHKAQGFALGSIEITQDWANLENDLRSMIADAKDDEEAQVFAVGAGAGSDQPLGVVTALAGGPSVVPAVTPETLTAADLYEVENVLPPKYRLAAMNGDTTASRASWIGARGTYNAVRQLDDEGGADLWVRLAGGLPPELIGHRAYEASAMGSATAEDPEIVLVLGDFRYFYIVDRVGLAVEYIPHVFGANGRPTGQRGWYAYWRVGSSVVNVDAFRALDLEDDS